MAQKKAQKSQGRRMVGRKTDSPDDFLSVARRLGCDEDKAKFEKKLGKIARAKVAVPAGRVK